MTNKSNRFRVPSKKLLYEEVVKVIFDSLIRGDIKPGERLIPQEISKELDISKTTIDRALQELARKNIVEIIPHKGIYIARWEVEDVKDFLRLRKTIEAFAAEQAAERIKENELNQIENLINEFEQVSKNGFSEKALEMDKRFHQLIVNASKNSMLISVYEMMSLPLNMFMVIEGFLFPSSDYYPKTYIVHKQVYDALKEHDPNKAKEMMENQFIHSEDSLVERMISNTEKLTENSLDHLIELEYPTQ